MTERDRLRWFRRFGRPTSFKLSWLTRITLLRILIIVPFVACMLSISVFLSPQQHHQNAVSEWLAKPMESGESHRAGSFDVAY